jgi:hypothetical protein
MLVRDCSGEIQVQPYCVKLLETRGDRWAWEPAASETAPRKWTCRGLGLRFRRGLYCPLEASKNPTTGMRALTIQILETSNGTAGPQQR